MKTVNKLKKYFSFLLIFFGMISVANTKTFISIDEKPEDSYLTELEKDVLEELNYARRDPKSYAKLIEDTLKFYDGKLYKEPGKITIRTNEGKKAVEEAVKVLKNLASFKEFKISKGMSLAAKDHVKDQSKTGKTGHNGSDGSSPFDRMNRYGTYQRTAGENISYGENTGRSVVFQLIVDDGVSSRGHRKNIYNKDFNVAGIACGVHKTYRHMCVITLAGEYQEKY